MRPPFSSSYGASGVMRVVAVSAVTATHPVDAVTDAGPDKGGDAEVAPAVCLSATQSCQ